MSVKNRMQKKYRELKDQMHRGREVTEQMKAERLRKKINKKIHMKDGAHKAIYTGLATKSSPVSVMKQEYSRRKYVREQKQKEREKNDSNS